MQIPKPLMYHQGCMLRFWEGKGTKAFSSWWRAPYDEIAKLYWSISRAPRQWPGDTEAIAFVASVKYQACTIPIDMFLEKLEDYNEVYPSKNQRRTISLWNVSCKRIGMYSTTKPMMSPHNPINYALCIADCIPGVGVIWSSRMTDDHPPNGIYLITDHYCLSRTDNYNAGGWFAPLKTVDTIGYYSK